MIRLTSVLASSDLAIIELTIENRGPLSWGRCRRAAPIHGSSQRVAPDSRGGIEPDFPIALIGYKLDEGK
jgi:hypothetical protein